MKLHPVINIGKKNKDPKLCDDNCLYFDNYYGSCFLFLHSNDDLILGKALKKKTIHVDGGYHFDGYLRCRQCLKAEVK